MEAGMSEFSDKLSEYIVKSGSNVYQLAKEASLDRTTLQKTAKGQRLPSLDYIREICQYIKISSNQEEELVRLYKIEKLGHSTVKAWDEIQQIILDIYQLRKNEKSSWHIRFDEVSLKSFNAQIVQKCDLEMDCLKAIMCVMEQELEDPDQAEIYMDVSWASKLVLCQLRQSEGNKSEKLTCHQLVNLKQTEHVKDGMLENIQMLHQVLPYAFTTHNTYDIRYAYISENSEDQKLHLWGHYIITRRHVILCSEQDYQMIVLSDEMIAKAYRQEVRRMLSAYRPLFSYQGYSGEGVRKYRALLDHDETHVTYEGFPCLALMIPDEIKKQLIADPQIGTYATAFFDMPKVKENQYINIFGMEEVRHFMKTGHLPGVFDHYFYAESMELRKEMLENFHRNLLAHTRQYYMINEDKFKINSSFGIDVFGQNKVAFCSTSDEFPFGFISIDEPGISEMFASYFDNLVQSQYVYSIEETITKWEELVEQIEREIEG